MSNKENIEIILDKLEDKVEKFYASLGYVLTGEETNVCCPSHNDNTPSCSINRTAGVFNCHGCGIHGDMIQFYREAKKVGIKQAIREIADKFEIKLKGEKKTKKDWKTQTCRPAPINLNSEAIQNHFKLKNWSPKVIELLKLDFCEHNETIRFPHPSGRFKLLPLDEREHRWDIDSEAAINPKYFEMGPYSGQPSLLVIEGTSDVLSLASYADENFNKQYYVVVAANGVGSTHNFLPDLNVTRFKDVYFHFDQDEAGQKEAQVCLGLCSDANNIITPEGDLREWLRNHTIKDYSDLLVSTRGLNSRIKERVEYIRKHPDKLNLAISDVQQLGVVDERTNIGIVFLCMLSHKFDNCVGFVLKGRFSSGKTEIVNTTVKLFPPDRIKKFASISNQGLHYIKDLSNMIIYQTEEHPAYDDKYWDVDSQLRQLISESEIRRYVTTRDPKTNEMVSNEYITKGPIAYGSTTTQNNINEENESRLVTLQTEDSDMHNVRIKDLVDRQIMGNCISEEEVEIITKSWQRFIVELPLVFIKNFRMSFANQLDIRMYGPERIRDYKKLLTFSRLAAYLNYDWEVESFKPTNSRFNLPISKHCEESKGIKQNSEVLRPTNGKAEIRPLRKIINITKADYSCAYELLKEFLNSKATAITQNTLRSYERIKKIYKTLSFGRKNIQEVLSIGSNRANQLLSLWLEEQMITKLEETTGKGGAYLYKINEGWVLYDADLTHPDELVMSDEKNNFLGGLNPVNPLVDCKTTPIDLISSPIEECLLIGKSNLPLVGLNENKTFNSIKNEERTDEYKIRDSVELGSSLGKRDEVVHKAVEEGTSHKHGEQPQAVGVSKEIRTDGKPTSKKDRLIRKAEVFCFESVTDSKQLKQVELIEAIRIVHPEVGDSYTNEALANLVVDGKLLLSKDTYGKEIYSVPKKKDAWKGKFIDE